MMLINRGRMKKFPDINFISTFIFFRPGSSQPQNNQRLQQTQKQVDEVVGIMRVNVEKVLERDQKLSELDHRADALQHGASQFEQQAGKLKRKQWWANMKMMIIMGLIGLVLLIIIIGEFVPTG